MKTYNSKSTYALMLALLLFAFCLTEATPVHAGMGLDFGGGGSDEEEGCVAETNPVIVPGDFDSPLRILPLDNGNYLVADYIGKAIYNVDQYGAVSPFFEIKGKALSVAVHTSTRRTRAPLYFVGNDTTRTIDIYRQSRNGSMKKKRFLRGRQVAIQALDMAYDSKSRKLYAVDGLTATIKVISLRGRVVALIGEGELNDPKGLYVDPVTGEVFVTDYGDSRIGIEASVKVFSKSGTLLKTINGSFSRPQGVTVTSDKIYIVDAMLAQVLEFDRSTGTLSSSFGCMGSGEGHLLLPMDVTLDSQGQNLHVVDNRNMRITVLPLAAGTSGGQP